MLAIVTPAEMAAIDAAAPEPLGVYVHRAGAAVARTALEMLGGAYGARVVVVAGPGNNGADGRDAAARLRRRGARVEVVEVGAATGSIGPCDLCIDAAFGTGLSRPWDPPPVDAPVLAVDIPSGVDGLTGERLGSPWRAEVTVTFAALKPGLLLGAGPESAGRVEVADIGLDVGDPSAGLVQASDVDAWVPPRARATHKWQAGVRIVAGSPGMSGAGHLVAAGAMRAGAGIVHATAPGTAGDWPVEVVERRADAGSWAHEVLDGLDRFGALAVGPGLGRLPSAGEQLAVLLAGSDVRGSGLAAVIDADALAVVERSVLSARRAPTILTPHEGEFARLAGAPAGADRFAAVRRAAAELDSIVLLKGPATLVARPDGHVLAVGEGDARLATAGTGDVLTGVISALLARGVEPFLAAAAGAFVHGRAARLLASEGVVAGDVAARIGEALSSCR